MRFFILTLFCNLLSSGHLQEAKSTNDYNLQSPDAGGSKGDDWPSQTSHTIEGNFYGQEQKNLPKPCSRRSNTESEPNQIQLTAPVTPKVTKPLNTYENANFKPQVLRNEEINLKAAKNQILTNPSTNYDDTHIHNSKSLLTISNPIIDSAEENHREIIQSKNEEIHVDKLRSGLRSINNFHTIPQGKFEFTQNSAFESGPPNDYLSAVGNVVPNSEPQSVYISPPIPHQITHSLRTYQEPSTPHPNNFKTAIPVAVPCSNSKEANDTTINSRRSMSSYNDDLIDSVREKLRNDKDLRQANNENTEALDVNTESNSNNLKTNKDQVSNVNKLKPLSSERSSTRLGKPQFNVGRREMPEPTKGSGVASMEKAGSGLMLMQSERICYACSTANNPTCWAPDRRTTVKYCKKGNNACITKTFGSGSTFTLIRDCGSTCDDSEMGGLMPRYKSCSMCHTELCNGAYSINSHSILLALFITFAIKYLS